MIWKRENGRTLLMKTKVLSICPRTLSVAKGREYSSSVRPSSYSSGG
jgi:hypothetical protein